MKHLAKIQVEFLKHARAWDMFSLEEQKDYLKHPKTKRRITARPETQLQQQLEEKRQDLTEHSDSDEIRANTQKIENDINSWQNNESKTIASSALSGVIDKLENTEGILLSKDGKSAGIALIENRPDKDYIKIKDIASNEKGYGTKLMNAIMDKAIEANKSLALVSMTTNANKFYEKMGMKADMNNSNIYRMSLDEIKNKHSST
jgi:DNA-binding transcriptional MerR regulator